MTIVLLKGNLFFLLRKNIVFIYLSINTFIPPVLPLTEPHDVLQVPGRRLYDHEVSVQLPRDPRGGQHPPQRACPGRHVHYTEPQLRHQQVEQQLHT